jgi:hypothetical protein
MSDSQTPEPAVTPEERNLLQHFLTDLAQSSAVSKDREADAMINEAVRANPSALYLLVQHAILADQALHATQAQLQAQQQVPPSPGFLPQAVQPSYVQPQYVQAQYAQPGPGQMTPWAGPGGAPVQSSPFGGNGGLGSFLKTAGVMAAGVAGGDFLFQGIENIFSPR